MDPNGRFALFAILCLVSSSSSFNIDVVHPLIYEDPYRKESSNSYFGYSVQMLQTRASRSSISDNWILVGAPKGYSIYSQHSYIVEPGQLYRCSVGSAANDSCEQALVDKTGNNRTTANVDKYEDRKDYGWLGGSVAVRSPTTGRVAVCAHRWANKIWSKYYLLNGACYWSDHDFSTSTEFTKMLPLINKELQGSETYNYAYGQAGTSLHMTFNPQTKKEEMLMGAPGVYNWTGTVVRVTDGSGINVDPSRRKRQQDDISAFSNTFVPHPSTVAQLRPLQYFGYSVSSGRFNRSMPEKLHYVAGAPRAAHMKGKVFVFDYTPTGIEIIVDKEGSQLGEYFGASVLVADLNGDGQSDLLVGAPLFCANPDSTSHSGDEGKVYVFVNRGNWVFEEKDGLLGGKVMNARFGSSMANVGDLNNDKYQDLIIGAPYEDSRGAVYLYHTGTSGISPRYSQRIAASDFPSSFSFRGFGISVSAADIDNNEYPDLVIGSYLSNQAVVLRSQPIVKIRTNLFAKPAKVQPVNGSSVLSACVNYTSKNAYPDQICVSLKIQLDVGFSSSRIVLLADGKNVTSTRTYNTTVRRNANICRNFSIYVSGNANDFSRPVTTRISSELLSKNCTPLPTEQPGAKPVFVGSKKPTSKSRDVFCSTCPVTDKQEPSYTDLSIPFVSGCGDDDKCEADLHVEAQFITTNGYLVIGSSKYVSLVANVTSFREPAYLPSLEVRLPSEVTLQRIPKNCKLSTVSSENSMRYSCSIPYALHTSQKYTIELDLDVSRIRSGSQSLAVQLEAMTNSELVPAPGHSSSLQVLLPLRTEADVTIIGMAGREQQIYQKKNETSQGTKAIPFIHTYEVTKSLASPVNEIEVEIFLPVFWPVSPTPTPLIEFHSIEGKHNNQPIPCKHTFTKRVTPPLRDTSNTQFVENRGIRRKKRSTFSKTGDFSVPANRTTVFNCTTQPVTCSAIVCTAGDVLNDSRISVSLNMSLLIGNLVDLVGSKDIFVYSTHGNVYITDPKNSTTVPNSHTDQPNSFVLSTYFIPQGPPAEFAPAWVLGLAVGGGILMLILITAILIKCGFFKRKRPAEMLNTEETAPCNDQDSSNELDDEVQEDQQLSK